MIKSSRHSGASRNAPEMYADGEGLSVRASKQGQLSWVFSYRLGGRGSKLERLTLGRYPDLSLKAAREKREKCRQWLAGGLDPKTELVLSTEETLKPVTVQDALEYWLVNYAEKAKRRRTGKGTATQAYLPAPWSLSTRQM